MKTISDGSPYLSISPQRVESQITTLESLEDDMNKSLSWVLHWTLPTSPSCPLNVWSLLEMFRRSQSATSWSSPPEINSISEWFEKSRLYTCPLCANFLNIGFLFLMSHLDYSTFTLIYTDLGRPNQKYEDYICSNWRLRHWHHVLYTGIEASNWSQSLLTIRCPKCISGCPTILTPINYFWVCSNPTQNLMLRVPPVSVSVQLIPSPYLTCHKC